jgi:hypothetical protein
MNKGRQPKVPELVNCSSVELSVVLPMTAGAVDARWLCPSKDEMRTFFSTTVEL